MAPKIAIMASLKMPHESRYGSAYGSAYDRKATPYSR